MAGLNKILDLTIAECYREQLRIIGPYINKSKIAKEIGCSTVTLWRLFSEANKTAVIDLDTLEKLEKMGVLKRPIVINMH